MAGASVKVLIEDQEARAMLARLGESVAGDLMPRLGEYLQGSTEDRFELGRQRAPDGTPWKALSPAYAMSKKRNKNRVLTLQGYLRRRIRWQPVGPNGVAVGTNEKYAAIHQFGGVIQKTQRTAEVRYRSVAGRILFSKKGDPTSTVRRVGIGAHQVKIDARPFLGISSEDHERIEDIIRDWVQRRAGR